MQELPLGRQPEGVGQPPTKGRLTRRASLAFGREFCIALPLNIINQPNSATGMNKTHNLE